MERTMMMSWVVISLAFFSHLIASCHGIPFPSTRINERRVKVGRGLLVVTDPKQIMMNEDEQEGKNGRMDLETQDYPGSTANYRHTPKPPPL